MLDEVEACFITIAREIASRERLLVVHPQPEEIERLLIKAGVQMSNVRFAACPTNDTWARDHGAITMLDTNGPCLLDFTFNGWGLKFAADKEKEERKEYTDPEAHDIGDIILYELKELIYILCRTAGYFRSCVEHVAD